MSHGVVQKNEKNGNGAQAPDSPQHSTDSPPPPPDGGWGWMVVFASFMIHIVTLKVTKHFAILQAYCYTKIDFSSLLSPVRKINSLQLA
uniref:SFRICE_035691 n=1 Tax=Spodoptera frugiperda TaxID=7108 RepID=A0A2H1WRN7_SPOFR